MPDEKKPAEAPPDPSIIPEHKVKNPMAKEPVVMPDGHVVLSQDDIDARA